VFVCNWLLGKLRARWGDPSRGQVWCAILGLSILIALLEVPILMMGVWVYAGGPMSMHLGPGIYDPVIFVESVACVAVYIGVYHFRNAQGERIVERGMAHYSSRRRKAVTLLALYTTLQLATWGPGTMPVALSSFYQHGWRKMPAYLVNALCDAPGISGTRYGPCPGSPGFRTPGRGSLPGESP
jgi:hypothetical protein